jgi:2-phosphosulfolactate phosphatase
MEFQRASLDTCAAAQDTVVVIDVLRAFTTAAYALAAGARQIFLVGTALEAFTLRERWPQALLMGEDGGLPIPGFDFWNSPAQLQAAPVQGRDLIQRTSAGTQGVVRSTSAARLLATSFVVAEATVRQIQAHAPAQVTFVETGVHMVRGDEDVACADWLEARLRGQTPDPAPYLARVRAAGRAPGLEERFVCPLDDLALSARLDAFDFALEIQREADLWVLRAAPTR